MEYLLKVSAVIAIFYVSYKLFLQRDTFFEQNRWFLLLGLITSFLVPFLVIPVYIEYTPVAIPIIYGETPIVVENTETPFTILDYLYIIYALGVTGFLIRFLIQLTSLGFVILKNKREKQGHYTFIKTTKNISPFSFFNWIVYNPNNFTKTELEQIITHEKVHVRQYHSIDNLLTQLSCIALWFNPFMWFYNKDLKQNLEFIADQETQLKSSCKKSYQTTLLKTSIPYHQMALSNPFYNSLIKKRIVMLHKSKSKKINLIKYAFVIPLLAIFLMSFNTEEIYVETIPDTVISNDVLENERKDNIETLKASTSSSVISKEIRIIFDKDLSDKEFKKIKKRLNKSEINFTYTELKRNSKGEILSINTKFESDGGYCTYNANTNPIKPFYFFKNKSESGVGLVEKVKSVIPSNKIKTKAIKNGIEHYSVTITKGLTETDLNRIIKEAFTKGITLKFSKIKRNSKNEIIAIQAEYKNKNSGGNFYLNGKEPINPYKIYQNEQGLGCGPGWETKFTIGKPMSNVIAASHTDSIIKKSKWKVSSGRNNSINTVSKSNSGVKINSIDGKEPLYIVDGKKITKEELQELNPDKIESISILKDKSATTAYGDKGKDGVVLITTKKKNNWKISAVRNESGKEPLFIVDGKEITKEESEKLNPDKIESINILKGDSANEKYGDKGKNGVVLITTKKKNPWKISAVRNESGKEPIFIVDGKEITKEESEKLNPDKIESINILKGDSANEKYGDKGENGVVLITTKKKNPWKISAVRNENVLFASKDTIYVKEKQFFLKQLINDTEKQPLYLLDGKEINVKDVAKLNEGNIARISQMKGSDKTIEQFGEKAKNGVVELTSKTENSKNPSIKVIGTPLYIVDGKKFKGKNIEDLNPDEIESVSVLKGDKAIKKYGDKGKDGVIEITTKKK